MTAGAVGAADAVARVVAAALDEDLGDSGDRTSAAVVGPDQRGSGRLVAREAGVVAGLHAARAAFVAVDPELTFEPLATDGDAVAAGASLAAVAGRLRSLLAAERTALNLLGRLSGVATATRRFVDAVEDTGCRIRDTRKTTPGLRDLEKAAVRAGGGDNHRRGLDDALLVKDNHVTAAGSVTTAARRALAGAGGLPVQVEVDRIDQIEPVLALGVTDVLLDNFSVQDCRRAVALVAGRARLEASGTITLDTVRAYASSGVDRIATGAVTHRARWLDVAFDVDVVDAPAEGQGR